MKMEFSFQRREMLLFLTTNVAAFTSSETFSLLPQVTQLLEGREKNNNYNNNNNKNNNNKFVCYTPGIR